MKRLEDLKAFMMATADSTRSDGSISVEALSDSLGFDREDGRNLAEYLDGLRWATIRREGETKLWLTELGHEKISSWRRPDWQQWLDAHPLTKDALMMTGTGIIAAVVSAGIIWLFAR